jgi:hypothetical protein
MGRWGSNRHPFLRWWSVLGLGAMLAILPPPAEGQVSTDRAPEAVVALERAREIDLGPFCLSNLPAGSVTVGAARFATDAIWWEVTVDVARGAGTARRPRAFFFERSRPAALSLEECSRRMEGVQATLAGDLNRATMRALFMPPQGGRPARWQVEPNELEVEFGRVETQFRPLFGGRFQPEGRLLWVTNPQRLLITAAQPQQGVLRLSTTDVELKGAKILLAQGLPEIELDLGAPSTRGRIELDLDISNGALSLVGGEFAASRVELPAGTWSGAGLEVELGGGSAGTLALRGSMEGARLVVRALSMEAPRLRHLAAPVASAEVAGELRVAEVSGPVADSETSARLEAPRWQGLAAEATTIEVMGASGAVELAGAGSLRLESLDAESASGVLEIGRPEIPRLARVTRDLALGELVLDFAGAKSAPEVAGTLGLAALRWGALALADLSQPAVALRSLPRQEGPLRFDFELPAGAVGGRFRLVGPAGEQVIVEGGVERLALAGTFDPGLDGGEPRLRVAPGGLDVAVAAEASVEPLLFGSRAQFARGSFTVGSPEGFEASSPGATGSLELLVEALALPDPALAFHDPSGTFLLQAPLRFETAAAVRFDLATAVPRLHRGRLLVEGLDARAADDRRIEAGGLVLTAPALAIARLEVEVEDGEGEVRGEGLRFEAHQAEHAGPPSWRVLLEDPLLIPRFEASLGGSAEAMELRSFHLYDLELAAREAEVRSPDGFTVRGAGARVALATLSDDAIDGEMSIASGTLDVDTRGGGSATSGSTGFEDFTLSLRRVGDELSGRGRVRLDDLSLAIGSRLEVGRCPAERRWGIRTILDAGRVDLTFALDRDGIEGEVVVPRAAVRVEDDGYSRCEWDQTHRIVEPKWAIFDVPCGLDGLKIRMCRVKTQVTPPVDVELHWVAELHDLQFSSQIRDLRVELAGSQGVRVCPGEILFNPPLVIANYHPNLREGAVPIVGDLLRDLIRGAATGFESALANVLGSQAAVLNLLRDTLVPPQCYGA